MGEKQIMCNGDCFHCKYDDCIADDNQINELIKDEPEIKVTKEKKHRKGRIGINWNNPEEVRKYRREYAKKQYELKKYCLTTEEMKAYNKRNNDRKRAKQLRRESEMAKSVKEVIQLLTIERECVKRGSDCVGDCKQCELLQKTPDLLEAYDKAIGILTSLDCMFNESEVRNGKSE